MLNQTLMDTVGQITDDLYVNQKEESHNCILLA